MIFGLAVYLHSGWFGTLTSAKAVMGLEVFALVSLGWLWTCLPRLAPMQQTSGVRAGS